MKRIVIALLLAAFVCVPSMAFANGTIWLEGGLGATVGIGDGVSFEGVGIFARPYIYITNSVSIAAQAEFRYSFAGHKDVTGLYVDMMVGYDITDDIYGYIGVGTDLHLVDGKLKANFGVSASSEFCITNISTGNGTFTILMPLTVRYNVLNCTDSPSLLVNLGASAVYSAEV